MTGTSGPSAAARRVQGGLRALVALALVLPAPACPSPPPRGVEDPRPDPTGGGGEDGSGGAASRWIWLRVSDSGRELDDSFSVVLDGAYLGETPRGGEATFQAEVPTGRPCTLRLTGSGIPDGEGTYSLELDPRCADVHGPPRSGADLDGGVTHVWTFTVRP